MERHGGAPQPCRPWTKKVKPITSTHTHTFDPPVVMPCCVMLCCVALCRVAFAQALRRPQTSRRRSLVLLGRANLGQKRYNPTDAHNASNNAFCNVRHRNTLYIRTPQRNATHHDMSRAHHTEAHLAFAPRTPHTTEQNTTADQTAAGRFQKYWF